LASAVDHVECAHELEAGVRELRLLAAHAPPYNRRSKFPQRWWWVALTEEAFPRFTVVRSPGHRTAVGPFSARSDAALTGELLARFTGVRTCTARFGAAAVHRCPERELSPCPAPQDADAATYAGAPERATAVIDGVDSTPLGAMLAHIDELAAANRYETAARMRDHAAVAIETLWRGQRLRALVTVPELVAARGDGKGGWQLTVIRSGQLAAAGTAARGVPPMPVVDALCAAAQVVLPGSGPLGGALVEETALIARWLAQPGVRIVWCGREEQDRPSGREEQDRPSGREEHNRPSGREEHSGTCDLGYATPREAAGRYAQWVAAARSARLAAQQGTADARSRDFLASELLTEPHPTREQLFGRTGVDGLGGTRQAGLPRRHPLGVAG
jgi:DNA polymerase-3 subunit epsilon